MKINFFNQTNLNVKEYQKVIKKALAQEENKKSFNVIFVDDEQIKEINNNYRKIDKVTDVISFALCDDEENDMDDTLGDIFIDLDQGIRQAKEYGHSIEREIAFLAVHGYLHLCGYDHMNKEDEKEMFAIQEDILKKANIERN